MPSFPTATKLDYYEIDGKLFVRVLQRDAVLRPDSIRAMADERLLWFVPVIATEVSNATK